MNQPAENKLSKAMDSIQDGLTTYACDVSYQSISAEAIQIAKARIIDTLGALIGGFYGEPCHIARNLAAQMPDPGGATVIGTRIKTTPDMAAFANAITSRYLEINDVYHWPGSTECHPSDVVTALLSTAEYTRSSGREFISSVVLAYEVCLRIADIFHNRGFDPTNFSCLGIAVAAGRLLGLSPSQLSHCISMAVVPNNILRQARTGHLTMFKAAAAGQAARAGVFAALLARAGMEGPHLPFEGTAGWCNHIARERFSLNTMGGKGVPFKILATTIKCRASCGTTISSILAAEKVAPVLKNIGNVQHITIEAYKKVKEDVGTGEHRWNPASRETADHSAPYVVAATLMDGTVTPHSFSDARLWNPELRKLMQKIEVVENDEFTRAYQRLPQQHRTRVTVILRSGERLVGESGGDSGDLSEPMNDAQITAKFRGLTEDYLGANRVNSILDHMWNLDDVGDVSAIPPAFVLG